MFTTPHISSDFALAIRPNGVVFKSPEDPELHIMFSYRSAHHTVDLTRYRGKELRGAKFVGTDTLPNESALWSELEKLGCRPAAQLRDQGSVYHHALAHRAELALSRSPGDFEALHAEFSEKLATVHRVVIDSLVTHADFGNIGRGKPKPTFPQYKGVAYWVTRSKMMVPDVGGAYITVRTLPGPLEGSGWHVAAELEQQSFLGVAKTQYAMGEALLELERLGIKVTPHALQGVNFRL